MKAMTRIPPTATLIIFGLASPISLLFLYHVGFDSFQGFDPANADIRNDWVVAAALVDGANPYDDLYELSRTYAEGGYRPPRVDSDAFGPVRTPRTPGALLLAVPLLAVPFGQVAQLNNLASVVLLVPAFLPVVRRVRKPAGLLLTVAVLVSVPMLWQLRFSSVSVGLAVLVSFAAVTLERKDSALAGVWLGLAATLKGFPLILIGLLIGYRRRHAALAFLGTVVLLNITPLFLPEVNLSDVLDALLGAETRFGFLLSNISVSSFLGELLSPMAGTAMVLLTSALAIAWVGRKPSIVSVDALFLLSLATLVTPLSWPHYVLAIYPLAFWVIALPGIGRIARAGIAVGFMLTIATAGIWFTAAGTALICLVAGVERIRITASPSTARTGPLPARTQIPHPAPQEQNGQSGVSLALRSARLGHLAQVPL